MLFENRTVLSLKSENVPFTHSATCSKLGCVFCLGTQILLVGHGIGKKRPEAVLALQVEIQNKTIMQIHFSNSPLIEVSSFWMDAVDVPEMFHGHQNGVHHT